MKRCLIIAGGEFEPEFASSYIKKKYGAQGPDLLIMADRGLMWADWLKMRPDIILGDYDSVSPDILERYQSDRGIIFMQYPAEKDYTDSHLAMETAIERGATEVSILGATGTRMDHALANMGLLLQGLKADVPTELVDAHNRIRLIRDSLILRREEQFGTYVSLLPYTESVTGITLTGFQYPLQDAEFQLGISLGVSNEIVSEKATVQIRDGMLFVIESKD